MAAAGRQAAPETALAYLELAAKFFAGRGVASARLDAELLLAEVLGTDRVGVYLRFDRPLGRSEVDAYRALVKRRGEGEPVAHLLGRREFWSRSFVVTPDVLVPRPETELVVERALAAVDAAGGRARRLRVLDLGTGSGALAVTLAVELPSAVVTAVDVSPAALAVAGRNAAALGVAARVRVVASDWTAALAAAARFDLVVGNPPYVPSPDLPHLPAEVRREPALALDGGADGLAAYRRIAVEAARVLAPGGTLVCEVGAGQAAAVAALFAAAGLGAVGRFTDLAGIERVVVGAAAGATAARAAS
ncbi:MAG: protein-(glutamine-N5) methyltransferase, release factor-specific [Polyangiaceae bacterium UTPRO1]|jgi:release factor glutamine methyltransferase|nr:peptide chain release factor N(5)-glutamine methyltransferase [Myxococcales bacterium]OQY67896.1 MAG: protein-(glutamine-N5) methyltransferase, release factor-specific [Polyangiaceae bacterium UTPRO1]